MASLSKKDKTELRKIIREYAFDLFKDYKRGETFSNVDPRNFFEIMNIDINHLLSHVNPLNMIHINQERSKLLALNLTETYEAEGHPSTGNEAKKSDFVKPFITAVIYSHNRNDRGEKVKLERELLIEHEVATGNVEYVLTNKSFVILIVEVKKDNWDLGRAQNMLEMFVAHNRNVENGALESHVIYGCISTGSEWEIFSYKSNNMEWMYHGRYVPLRIVDPDADIVFDRQPINDICAILNGMIKDSIASLH